MKLLDLFCGRGGWTNGFMGRGWDCIGIDLTAQPEYRGKFLVGDVLELTPEWIAKQGFDFIFASSPCEQFSVHGMKHFHPNPPYPEMGIKLFNHTRMLCEASGLNYVMENVRPAQQFVGNAVNHCGPFYLWGNAVPPLMPQGIIKGLKIGSGSQMKNMTREQVRFWRKQYDALQCSGKGKERQAMTAKWATIPAELSRCVVDYAERILNDSTTQDAEAR